MKHDFSEIVAALDGVEGWLSLTEAHGLYDAVLELPPNPTVVEIGSWKGRSSIVLGLAVKHRGDGKVFAIDPHTGSVEHRNVAGLVDTFAEWTKNVERAGVSERVTAIRETSHDARPRFVDHSIDLLFLDGSHEFCDVLQDFNDWISALHDGAILACNDFGWPGVARAIAEKIGVMGAPFACVGLHGNSLFFSHDSRVPASTATAARLRRLLLFARFGQAVRRFLPRRLTQLGRGLLKREADAR